MNKYRVTFSETHTIVVSADSSDHAAEVAWDSDAWDTDTSELVVELVETNDRAVIEQIFEEDDGERQ